MAFVLFCLFLLVPLLELSLLIEVAQYIGLLPTITLSLSTAALGAHLAKREFKAVWQGWQKALAEREPPTKSLVDGVLIGLGALMLFVPGVVTDALGFFLLIPSLRALLTGPMGSAMTQRVQVVKETTLGQERIHSPASRSHAEGPKLIDAEYESIDEWGRTSGGSS